MQETAAELKARIDALTEAKERAQDQRKRENIMRRISELMSDYTIQKWREMEKVAGDIEVIDLRNEPFRAPF